MQNAKSIFVSALTAFVTIAVANRVAALRKALKTDG